MIDYAQMLQMQGGNQGAARIGDLALNGGRTDVGAHLLGAVPRTPNQGQIPRPGNYGSNTFDINGLMANAQSRAQPVPVAQPAAPMPVSPQPLPSQPAPSPQPVVAPPPQSLQNVIQQSNATFGQTLGLPVPAPLPIPATASPAAQMAAQPSYSDIMFGTSPKAAGTGYYDPLKQSWNQGANVKPSAYYDPLKGY